MILVTGATGLAGSHMLYECLRNSSSPILAQYKNGVNLPLIEALFRRLDSEHGLDVASGLALRVKWAQADMLDEVRLAELFCAGIEEVFHTAALVHVGKTSGSYMLDLNVQGTAKLVNVALQAQVRRFVHFSSVAALPRKLHEKIDERMTSEIPEFPNTYAQSKFRAEMEVWRGVAEGLPATIVNPAVILGFGDYRRSSLNVVDQVAKGLRFYPSGGNAIVDARDLAEATWKLSQGMGTIGQRYLFAAGTVPFKAMLQTMAETLGKRKPSIMLPPSFNGLFVAAMAVKCFLKGEKSFITRQLADITSRYYYYDTAKLKHALPGFQFRDPMKTIVECAAGYPEYLKVIANSQPAIIS